MLIRQGFVREYQKGLQTRCSAIEAGTTKLPRRYR